MPREAHDRSRAAPRAKKKRVLIVEDNRDAAEMLGMLIDAFGHEVRLAHAAVEALGVLAQWRADVVLSDIGLPDMDGFAFAERVRARPAAADQDPPYLVAISGYGSDADKSRARDAGFDAYLTKPVDGSTLERVLAAPRQAPSS